MGKGCTKKLEKRIEALEEALAELAAGGSNTDEQTLNLSGSVLEISDGNSVDLSPFLDDTDQQVVSANLTGTDLVISISNGNTVTVPLASIDTDTDTDDQTLAILSNMLEISDGNSVDLSPYLDNTDSQTLDLTGTDLAISGGNSIDLSPYLDNTDSQTVSVSLNGTDLVIAISNGNMVTVPLASIDTDDQTLSILGNTLTISEGNSVDLSPYLDNTDSQTLSLAGNRLSISGGNFVDIPTGEAAAIYQTSGRAYLYSNQWRGINANYGFTYYQWADSKGTGVDPVYKTQSEQGFLVVGAGILTKIRLLIERSSTVAYDVAMDVAIIRNETVIPAGRLAANDNSADNRFFEMDLNIPVLENDIITWAFRKSAGALTYGYCVVSAEIS